ncbi:MAG: dTDP-4-dehydrorhamnose 3,5-epimerase [Hyphomicrobiaceae bacterium]|nr:dTDP-4-dehydrorhamnose 3,5-epimerase [Hyphomicrobiaceae bacterium]
MQFKPLALGGSWLIEPEPFRDERGAFMRTFCEAEFGSLGLVDRFPQHSLSVSHRRGTLRGLHFQRCPHAEVKVVRCVGGVIFDVIVDLRPESATYRQWVGVELSAANGRAIYVPEGFAHGCQTLTDDAVVCYLISSPYEPDAASGVRFDDPVLAIGWPLPVSSISERDRSWPGLD